MSSRHLVVSLSCRGAAHLLEDDGLTRRQDDMIPPPGPSAGEARGGEGGGGAAFDEPPESCYSSTRRTAQGPTSLPRSPVGSQGHDPEAEGAAARQTICKPANPPPHGNLDNFHLGTKRCEVAQRCAPLFRFPEMGSPEPPWGTSGEALFVPGSFPNNQRHGRKHRK